MRAVDFCEAKLYDAYFAHSPEAEIVMGPGWHNLWAYCAKRISEVGTPAQNESAIDTITLADVCEDPAVGALLGACMLFAVQDIEFEKLTDRSDLRYCFPTVERLKERIEMIQILAPDFQPPELRRFDGNIYHADQQMEALIDGTILIK